MITRTVRRVTIAALSSAAVFAPAVALATTAAPSRTESPAAPAAPAALPCQTPGLVVWLKTNGSGTAGGIYYRLEFTNLTKVSCTLNGYPFLYAINLAGSQVGKVALMGPPGTTNVTIGVNKSAHAFLKVSDPSNYPPTSCHPVIAAGFRVFPPNQQRAKVIPFPVRTCSGKSANLSVGKVLAGS